MTSAILPRATREYDQRQIDRMVSILGERIDDLERKMMMLVAAVYTPVALTGSVNDYMPVAAWPGNAVVRLSSTGAVNVTGLRAAGVSPAHRVALTNVGANTITLKNENASSAAANRLALNADIALGAKQGCLLAYDQTLARWVALATY
jgi:hypothetical protein